jgi:dTDP-glucose 4,6-dehydratase
MKLLVTGGAGFIGSAFIRMWLAEAGSDEVVNLDALTYAGNLENLASVANDPRYSLAHVNLCEADAVGRIVAAAAPDAIVHFAAESHVDRSILSPRPAIDTNFVGTFNLLEAAKSAGVQRFIHVSTDEVYGSIEAPHEADESAPLRTSSPYSASKAGSDMLALSYCATYGMSVSVTRASNNYGPYQFPEKLIPLMIANALEDKALPVYGDGLQIRDWLYVDDHCRAIRAVLEHGEAGEIYNVGGSKDLPNIDVIHKILKATEKPASLIEYVKDRPGHDVRYAITSDKIMRTTGWKPEVEFEQGLQETIHWYQENAGWVERVRSGEYRKFYESNYATRLSASSD